MEYENSHEKDMKCEQMIKSHETFIPVIAFHLFLLQIWLDVIIIMTYPSFYYD